MNTQNLNTVPNLMSLLLLHPKFSKFSTIELPNNLCMASYLPLSLVDHKKLLKPPGTLPPRTWRGLCPGQPHQPRWAQWPCGEDLRPVLGSQGWAEKDTPWYCTHPHPLPTTGRASFLALLSWMAISWLIFSLTCTTCSVYHTPRKNNLWQTNFRLQ